MDCPNTEKQFERPVERYLHRRFVRDILRPQRGTCRWFIANTSEATPLDGPFTVPDLLLVTVVASALKPMPVLEIVGFELKLRSNLNNRSVAQAVSQHLYTDQIYLVVCMGENPGNNSSFHAVSRSAQDQGVGLIYAVEADNAGTYHCVARSNQRPPERDKLDRLMTNVLGSTHRDRLHKWLNTTNGPAT